MTDFAAPSTKSREYPLIRRRNSISTSIMVIPTKLTLIPNHSSSSATASTTSAAAATSSFSSFPSDDLELLSIKSTSHSYTSLKDLLPSFAVNSPKPNSPHQVQLGSDISIRNRLVKQAAWAYLRPMSSSPCSDGANLFHRLWPRVAAFFDFIRSGVVRLLDWTLRIIRIRSSR